MIKMFIGWLLCTVMSLAESTLGLALLEEANHTLVHMRSTYYTHHMFIDEDQGIYGVDCSSFMRYLLRKTAPTALSQLPTDPNYPYARARNFYNHFSTLKDPLDSHWMAIKRFDQVEAGDIIAWKYDPSLKKNDTGHVVLVAQKPQKKEEGLYWVQVIDASKGRHANDTRYEGIDGIGRGEMWFRVDEKEAPISLFWSDKSKKESFYPLAIGRVILSR